MKKVSVIIPVYHAPSWFDFCLDCVDKTENRDELEVIVVCNSKNMSIKNIIDNHRVDQVLDMDVNLGTGAAFNEGALASTCPYICFLHTDSFVMPSTFKDLLSSLLDLRVSDSNIIGTIPVTNYAMEHSLLHDNELIKRYTEFKPSNKALHSKADILNILGEFYENKENPYQGMVDFSAKIKTKNAHLYNILIEISHYCLMLDKNAFFNLGMFDIDFYPIGYFEKLFYENALRTEQEIHLCKSIYVHHNGNTTSDTFGFDHAAILEQSKELFAKKKKALQELEMEQLSSVLEAKKRNQLEKFSKITSSQPADKNLNSALFIRHGGVGDIIMTLPFIKDLKAKNPECKISYMAHPQHRDLLESIDEIYSFIETEDIPSFENWQDLIIKNRGFSLFFDIIYDWTFYAEVSESAKEKSRIDIFAEKYGTLPPIEFPTVKIKSNTQIKEQLGTIETKILFAPIATTKARTLKIEEVQKMSDAVKDKLGSSAKIIVVDNNEQQGLQGDNIINLTGQLSLAELLYVVSLCDVVVSVDSGVFHMAALFNKPCLGLFGSIPPELRAQYYQNKLAFIYQKEQFKCVPCFDHGCDLMPCLNSIDMSEFIHNLESLMSHDD